MSFLVLAGSDVGQLQCCEFQVVVFQRSFPHNSCCQLHERRRAEEAVVDGERAGGGAEVGFAGKSRAEGITGVIVVDRAAQGEGACSGGDVGRGRGGAADAAESEGAYRGVVAIEVEEGGGAGGVGIYGDVARRERRGGAELQGAVQYAGSSAVGVCAA